MYSVKIQDFIFPPKICFKHQPLRNSMEDDTFFILAAFVLILDDSSDEDCPTEYIDYIESTLEEDDEVLYVKTLRHPHLHKRNLLFRK